MCSAAFYLDDDAGVLISACLFGDGAGAAVLSPTANGGRRVKWKSGGSLLKPADREPLRFEQKNGMLRNILTPEVPALAAQHCETVFADTLARSQVARSQISGWVFHPGGRDVLLALREKFQLSSPRRAPERSRVARTRKHEQPLGFICPAGGAGGQRAWRLLVDVVVWRGLQLPRRAAGSGITLSCAMERIVLPELLDALPPQDQSALRSRRDLRRLNAWMRHPRIMARLLQKNLPNQDARHIVELGAGDGHFLLSVARRLQRTMAGRAGNARGPVGRA